MRDRHMNIRIAVSLSLTLAVNLLVSPGLLAATAENAPDKSAKTKSWSADYANGLAALDDQKPTDAEGFFAGAGCNGARTHKPTDQEQCLRKLGDALLLRGKTSQAEAVFQNLRAVLTKRYGDNSPKTAPVLMVLGSIQESLGDHSAAVALYQKP